METFANVIQPSFDDAFNNKSPLKGNWRNSVFNNPHPLVLELGCGKGEYTLGLSSNYPEKNFIGIDIKGARMWIGAGMTLAQGITNAYFLRTRIEFIRSFFSPNEVDEIWITFPDPQAKIRRNKKRLTSAGFLSMYQQFLKPDGLIHLKTDSAFLYHYTSALIQKNNFQLLYSNQDLYNNIQPQIPALLYSIKTHYEQLFLNKGTAITYLCFTIPSNKQIIELEEDQIQELIEKYVPQREKHQ